MIKYRYLFILCILLLVIAFALFLPVEKMAKNSAKKQPEISLESAFKELGFESEKYYFSEQKKCWAVGKDNDTYLVYKNKQEKLSGIPFDAYKFIDEYRKEKVEIVSYESEEKLDWLIKKYPNSGYMQGKATIDLFLPKADVLTFLQECAKKGLEIKVSTYMSPSAGVIEIGGLFYPTSGGLPAIGHLRPNDIDLLIQDLKNESSLYRENAALALGRLKDAKAVEPLIAALKDKEPRVRYAAAQSLGAIKDSSAINQLITLLNDSDVEMQCTAAIALGNIGDKSALPALQKALQDKNEYVRKYAQEAIEKINANQN